MITALSVLALSTVAPNAAVPESNLTIVQVEGPGWTGEFTVRRVGAAGDVRLTLEGQMEFVGQGEAPFDAMLTFSLPAEPLKVRSTEEYRVVTGGSKTQILHVEETAANTAIWSNHRSPAMGNVIVYESPVPSLQLTDAQTASMFIALLDASQRMACSPDYTTCLNDAKSSCHPNGLGSFMYTCDPDTGEVTCDFTCRETPPG